MRLRSGATLAAITVAATAMAALTTLAVLAMWWATDSTAGAQEGGAAVNIIDFGFDAPEVSIPVGTTLTWTNTGARPHTATDRGGTFDTQPINPGEQGSITFTAPGTYFYFCRINPLKMNAVVKVDPGPEPSKAVRVQTVDPGNIEGEQLRFDPPQLTVPAGTTLLIANVGGKPHSFTAEDASFSSGIIQPGPEAGRFAGSNATLTLSQPGTFNFFCEIHPAAMKGTITVSGAAAAADAGPAPPSNGARTANVSIADFEFKEPQISVAPDAEITFRNIGEAPHTATFDDVNLDTGNLDTGGTAKLTAPNKPGSYSYFCAIHTKMRGVVVVLGQNTADPAAAPSTTAAGGANAADEDQADGGGSAAPTVTVAPNPPTAYTAAGTISGAMKGWVIGTVAVGFFLGGVGITPFLRRRASSTPGV